MAEDFEQLIKNAMLFVYPAGGGLLGYFIGSVADVGVSEALKLTHGLAIVGCVVAIVILVKRIGR